MIRNNLSGSRFGRLIVSGMAETFAGHNRHWNCVCDCGGVTKTTAWKLKNGITTSCGCYNKERIMETHTTHGMSQSAECHTWYSIKQRCYNEKNKEYKYYGGRGVKMSESWLSDFANFFKDMGARPSNKHSIEREDVNGDYTKENCKWVTKDVQANNTRTNVYYMYEGEKLSQSQLSRKIGVSNKTLWAYLNNNHTIEEAISFYFKKKQCGV